MVLAGFVERVGDPVPLVAADGSPHRGEQVLVEALDAMARTVGGGAPIAIAVPAHWSAATVGALRGALRATPSLAPNGMVAALVPDSVAALSALQSAPGLPPHGVVVLCDFGGSGTSVTLANAGANFDTIGETVRYPDFSGDQIDQALLNHVVAGIAEANDSDPASTAAVGSLARLRNDCRLAKEQLSAETAAAVHAELPGFASDVRVTRTELEQLIAEPLNGLLDTVEETLQRNNIGSLGHLGGRDGRRRREHPAGHPAAVDAAARARRHDAAITAERGRRRRSAGRQCRSGDRNGHCRRRPDGDGPDRGLGRGRSRTGAAGAAAAGAAADDPGSSTFRALAWSQDDVPAGGEPVPYTGEDYTFDPAAPPARPARRWSSATRRRASRPNPGRCPGTSARPFCSGPRRPPCCWPSAAWRSR